MLIFGIAYLTIGILLFLNKQIAHELGVSETTVKAHVSEILRKLNVVSRTQAVIATAQLDFETILGSEPTHHRT